MRQFWNTLFSSKVSMLVLSAFIIIVGIATFIENKYDTATAKLLIYNAKWFEFLMLALVIFFMVTTSFINEKLLTIGLFLAALGTFIGCVWANESWGTYWGWDPKETWSLIIVLVYGLVLHLKFIPKMQSHLVFNIASVISFASIIMTFVGVNYYFTKGLHSYASDDPPVFPVWAWITLIVLILLIATAIIKENYRKKGDRIK